MLREAEKKRTCRFHDVTLKRPTEGRELLQNNTCATGFLEHARGSGNQRMRGRGTPSLTPTRRQPFFLK